MTFLLSPIARYLAGAGVLCLAFVFWLHRHDALIRSSVEAQYAAIASKAREAHQLELDDARKERLQHAADLAAYVAAHPIQPVRLCLNPHAPAVRSIEANTAPSTAPADVQPVSEGDSDVRSGVGPDLAGLLTAFAAAADSVADDLREQQAVP